MWGLNLFCFWLAFDHDVLGWILVLLSFFSFAVVDLLSPVLGGVDRRALECPVLIFIGFLVVDDQHLLLIFNLVNFHQLQFVLEGWKCLFLAEWQKGALIDLINVAYTLLVVEEEYSHIAAQS